MGPPTFLNAPPELLASAFMSNPFEFMRRMNEDMQRLLGPSGSQSPARLEEGRPAARGLTRGRGAGAEGWTPQLEVFQRSNEIVVRADLPGLKKEDVSVEIEEGMLLISGERRNEFEDQGEGYFRTERSYGSFLRALPLPENANADEIEASFKDGVLELRIPTRPQEVEKGRRIDIR